jgi:regulator of protease activity HflC (stomatin/prohibitin superfamily)
MNVTVVLDALVGLIWLAVVGLIVLAIVRASRTQKVGAISTAILVLAIVAVLLTSLSAGLVFIQPAERGVVISAIETKGYRETALQPGLRWVVPFFENVVTYSIARQTYTMSIAEREGQLEGDDSILARTSDGQEVKVDASVIFSVNPEDVISIHINWQNRYSMDLVRPLARGVIRDAVSQFGVEEVYSSKRNQMAQEIRDNMEIKLRENGLLLVDFVLRNITFSSEYAASVEQKQIAEQLAQQARFVVEQRRQEAEQARQVAQGRADAAVIGAQGQADARIIEANAEAQALLVLAAALADNPELLNYLYIVKLNPNVQIMLLGADGPNFLYQLPPLQPSTPVVTPTPTPTPTPAPTATP